MLYADHAAIASKSAEGLAKTMTVIVTVFKAAGPKVSDKKAETMLLRTPDGPGTLYLTARRRGSRPEV